MIFQNSIRLALGPRGRYYGPRVRAFSSDQLRVPVEISELIGPSVYRVLPPPVGWSQALRPDASRQRGRKGIVSTTLGSMGDP